ncbi:MAG TPA: 3-methyl-2-oxobutanoate hydroxymethyltransferase [Actinomycetota bacterium]|nr:3-methyl-2-oxobutanoate hydroxymethyltransferase [Actinomycetota bacterium]
MAVTVRDLRKFKERGERFVMLTAYDYPTARVLDEAGVPVILVGDSLAQNVLGYETTLPVTMEEMLHHTRAVARAVRNALVVGDMPFLSYQVSLEEGIRNAGRFLKEAGAHAVKVEGPVLELAAALVERGIPVMGHIGLTPQSVHAMGGYRVQGRTEEEARRLLSEAQALEKSGVFSLVLEGIPAEVARRITEAVAVPTIGIGAGPHCDGQVLVLTDLLGLTFGPTPKFAKAYADLRAEVTRAVRAFQAEVAAGAFPDKAHYYH